MVRSSTVNAIVVLTVLGIAIYIFMIFVNGGGLTGIMNLLNRRLPQQQQQQQPRQPSPPSAAPPPSPAPSPQEQEEDEEEEEEEGITPSMKPDPFPHCNCPQKPHCNDLCNSPDTFRFCCFGTSRTYVAKVSIA